MTQITKRFKNRIYWQ